MVESSIRAGVCVFSLVMNKCDITFIRDLIVDYTYKLLQGVKPRNRTLYARWALRLYPILYLPQIATETIALKMVIL